jgi:hypothetical protein
MPARRPIDILRDSGGRMEVSTPEDQSDIVSMCEINGSIHVIKRQGIYKIILPDEIDPKRTNPVLPTTQQQILAYGSDCKIVVQTILTANRLFNPVYLGSAFDKKRGLDLAFGGLLDLISMHEMAISFEKAEDEAKTKAAVRAANRGALFLPSLGDVRGRCESFIHKADHAFFVLFDIVKLFYSDIGAGLFDGLASFAAERYGEQAQFTSFVNRVAPFLKCIRQTRNCVQHPKAGQLINVQDFIPPTIELIQTEASLPPMPVLEFIKRVTADFAKVFEG